MTEAQQTLLLTVARILRARLADMPDGGKNGDWEALNDALMPFDPVKREPFNESSFEDCDGQTHTWPRR